MRHTVPWHCHCGSPASWFAQSLQVGKLLAGLGKGRVGERKLMADGGVTANPGPGVVP